MGYLLWKKMARDIRRALPAYLLCALLTAIGFCGFSVLKLCHGNLTLSRDVFFRQSGYCDGYGEVEDAPKSLERRLSLLEGVETADGRLVKNVPVDGYGEDVVLHLVSWSEGQPNRPVLSKGFFPEPGKRELIIGGGIAKARKLEPGDSISLAVNGRRMSFTITGVGLTPENIYMIKDLNEMMPNPASYDAAFMPYETMAAVFDLSGHVDSFLINLSPGTEWEEVEETLRQTLEGYGVRALYPGEDQTAAAMLGEEITQLGRMSSVVPFLFLSVAGVILYISLSRLVEQQRIQVGTLAALGIPARMIRLHYLSYGLFTGLFGGIFGSILGYVLSGPMAGFYRMYFNLPAVKTPLSPAYFFEGAFVSALFTGAVSYLTARSLGREEPAAALRPPAPKSARKSWLERIPGFLSLFTVPGVMALRNLSRNRRRTAMALTGMAFAYMITATLVSMNSLFDIFLFDYWEDMQKQDVTVAFQRPVPERDVLNAVTGLSVDWAEGVMEFPATLRGPKGSIDASVKAVAPDSRLSIFYRADKKKVEPETEGILITEQMAAVLGVSRGDLLEAVVPGAEEKRSRIPVTDITAQYMGGSACISKEYLPKISDYGNAVNRLLIKASPPVIEALRDKLKDARAVSSVSSRGETLESLRGAMGSMSSVMASMAFLGVIISVSVIYTSSLISFEEQKREVSTLLMLGLTSRECLDVISVSQWLLAAGAVVLGIPMTMGASAWMSAAMSSDLYVIPDFVDGKSLGLAALLTAVSVWFASFMMHRKLKKLVPADLLRERE